MKRFLAGALLLIILISLGGCAEKADKAVPVTDYYEVQANGRTYTTAGCPFRYEPTAGNEGYLNYRTNLVGKVGEDLTGTFPEGTALYGLRDAKNKYLLLAVVPAEGGGQYCYLVTSVATAKVTVGQTIADAIDLDHSFAYVYRYTADKSGWIILPMTSSQLMDLGYAYAEGGLIEPQGKSVELVVESFSGHYAAMTLYENGALVYAGCPQYAIDLGEEMAGVLWGYLR